MEGQRVRRLDKMDEQREELMKTKEETAPKEIRSLLDDTTGHAVRFLEGLPKREVASTATVEELRSALGESLPDGPRDPRAVISDPVAATEPGLVASAGGRYFGFVVGGSLFVPRR